MITKIKTSILRTFDFKESPCVSVEYAQDKRFVSEQVKDERSKRIVTRSKFVPINPIESTSKYRVSDFALENLMAIGAKLDRCKLSPSNFVTIKNIENHLSNIVESSNIE